MSKNLIIGIVAAVLLGGSALYIVTKPTTINPTPVVQNQQTSPTTSITAPSALETQTKQASTSALETQPKPPPTKTLVAKPVAVASILGLQMSSGLTSSGAALKSVATFSTTVPTIYAVLSLKNATQHTQLSYIRYYNGKYVDSKVSHPSKDGAKYFHFNWVLNAGQTRNIGNYALVFYVDGKKVQTVNYSVI